jgi:hypothetical protein
MARQYGAPKFKPGQDDSSYSEKRRDAEPQAKPPDRSPPSDVVVDFHKNAPVDTRREDVHHTIGTGNTQAASGDHSHRGGDSVLLLEGVTLSGSKAGNAALASVVAALVQLGAKDTTT